MRRRFRALVYLLVFIALIAILLLLPQNETESRRKQVEQKPFLPAPPCDRKLKMIILVKSACGNRERRSAIRETCWGEAALELEVPVRFFVGRCPAAGLENVDLHDVVEGHYVDSTNAESLKTLSMFHWYNEKCRNSDMILVTDDDVLVNVKKVLESIYVPLGSAVVCSSTRTSSSMGIRKYKSNQPELTLPENFTALTCLGFAQVWNGEAVKAVLEASLHEPVIGTDFALFTGYVGKKIGLAVLNESRFTGFTSSFSSCDREPSLINRGYDQYNIRHYWPILQKACWGEVYQIEKESLEENNQVVGYFYYPDDEIVKSAEHAANPGV